MCIRVVSGAAKQLKTWDLRKLANFKEIPKYLVLMGNYSAKNPKENFVPQNFKTSAVKHFIEKPMLPNFVNLSAICRPRLYMTNSGKKMKCFKNKKSF